MGIIPAAERYGSIINIDRWVVTTVIQQYEHLFPDSSPVVSINLSGASLSDERFLNYVHELILESDIDPNKVCFEITETSAITFIDHAISFIHELKAMGVSFALDDFGSGVASFAYLRKLPVDYLKIDGSLVRSIADEPYDLAVVEMITRLAHLMDMQTIAEYVETPEITSLLQSLGVDYLQGYAIDRPAALPAPLAMTESEIV